MNNLKRWTAGVAAAGTLLVGSLTAVTTTAVPALAAPGDTTGCGITDVILSPDLNGDGGAEIISQRANGDLYAYPLKADGKFGTPWMLGRDFNNMKLYAPGDWDGDGWNDLIGVTTGGKMILYSGGFGYTALVRGVEIGHGWGGFKIIPVGDITGDGINDMLAITEKDGKLWLYAGNGKGGFKYPYPQVGHGWNLGYELYPSGDVNGDGKGDILAIRQDGKLFFYQGRGNGTFLKAVEKGHGWDSTIELRAGTDLNRDGRADIVGWKTDGTLWMYLSRGGGSFSAATQIGTGWNNAASCPNVSAGTATTGFLSDPQCARVSGPAVWLVSADYPNGICANPADAEKIKAAIAPYHHPEATQCAPKVVNGTSWTEFDGAGGHWGVAWGVSIAKKWAATAANWQSGRVLKIEVTQEDKVFVRMTTYACENP